MIIPCVTKPCCTHGIIISLWLICYIQRGFSVSYLSILGIVAHDRCNIYHNLLFLSNFNVQCRAVPFIYITTFQQDSERGSVVGRWVVVVWGHNYLFADFSLFNFSQCLWTSFLFLHNGIYYYYF